MGEVYRASDTRLHRDVALKTLPAGIANSDVRRARFEREALAISQLNHPNICAIYDIGVHDGVSYFVMEHVDGESLAHRLRRGPLEWPVAVKWAIQIATALDAAHRRGITHRDVKPANVMVSGDLVKLLDPHGSRIRLCLRSGSGRRAGRDTARKLLGCAGWPRDSAQRGRKHHRAGSRSNHPFEPAERVTTSRASRQQLKRLRREADLGAGAAQLSRVDIETVVRECNRHRRFLAVTLPKA